MAGTRKLGRFDLEGMGDADGTDDDASRSSERSRVADPRALKTRLARKFTTLADEVNECFCDFFVGAGQWGVELTAPEGMSTAGGKQALQHLRMRPKQPGHPVLVAGVVNVVEKTAELRDHVHIDMIHRVRFGAPLEITDAEWEQLLRRAEVVLKVAGIRAVRVGPGLDLLARSRARRGSTWRSYALLVAAITASVGAITVAAVHFV